VDPGLKNQNITDVASVDVQTAQNKAHTLTRHT